LAWVSFQKLLAKMASDQNTPNLSRR
jgi:nucleotidyltransferase/DNA polymerase involved in DNA repair